MSRITAVLLLLLLPTAASAHVIIGDTGGLVHGFLHPIGGVDHVLAMVAVGLFAVHLGGRAVWLVPLTFVSTMTLAGVLGMAGVKVPFVESGIALSVVILGLAIAFQLNVPTFAAMALVGYFAIFHGYAHGAEMPKSVSGYAYGIGFVCATTILHAIGIGVGLATRNAGGSYGRRIAQVGGSAMAVAGVTLLAKIL